MKNGDTHCEMFIRKIFVNLSIQSRIKMSKVIKISDSTSLKLKELMNILDAVGCSLDEKIKARKIIKIYLDGRAEINK